MAVYRLTQSYTFPNPELAEPSGLLAVGGDLHPERLLRAYAQGIFPFPCEGLPITWYSPNPRMILRPEERRVTKSLRKTMRSGRFVMKADTAFEAVIDACRNTRDETWITPQIRNAYIALHHLGFAHSIETWQDGKLVGGLYGVSLGRAFFGESMFHLATDASKAAFMTMCAQAERWKFSLIDCQLHTDHLESLGAYTVPRTEFMQLLDEARKFPTRLGRWQIDPTLWNS